MATNTLITEDLIAKTSLMEFKNNLQLAKTVNRQYQNVFSNTTGDTVRIYKPVRFDIREGSNAQIQNIEQRTEELKIQYQDGVDVALTSKELSLELDDFNRTVIRPAMLRLANKVDQRIYATSKELYHFVGTAGTAPSTYESVSDAQAMLDSFGIDETDRFLAMSVRDAGKLRSGLYNTFNTKFNSPIIMRGMMGNIADFDVYQAQNTIRPPVADGVIGTPLVNGADQSGAVLNVDGFTAGITIYEGAVFTCDGIESVNPLTRQSTGRLMQFTVSADTVVDGGGAAALPIKPTIVLDGPYRNVTAAPADNATLTFEDQHTINIAYHREAFTLACINLHTPQERNSNGATFQRMVDADAGVSLRMVRQYDIKTDRDICRFDILYGIRCFPEYGARLMGS